MAKEHTLKAPWWYPFPWLSEKYGTKESRRHMRRFFGYWLTGVLIILVFSIFGAFTEQ